MQLLRAVATSLLVAAAVAAPAGTAVEAREIEPRDMHAMSGDNHATGDAHATGDNHATRDSHITDDSHMTGNTHATRDQHATIADIAWKRLA